MFVLLRRLFASNHQLQHRNQYGTAGCACKAKTAGLAEYLVLLEKQPNAGSKRLWRSVVFQRYGGYVRQGLGWLLLYQAVEFQSLFQVLSNLYQNMPRQVLLKSRGSMHIHLHAGHMLLLVFE